MTDPLKCDFCGYWRKASNTLYHGLVSKSDFPKSEVGPTVCRNGSRFHRVLFIASYKLKSPFQKENIFYSNELLGFCQYEHFE